MLIDPPSGPPIEDRYRGGEFYIENDTLYLYSSGSWGPRIIVYAVANEAPDVASRVSRLDDLTDP